MNEETIQTEGLIDATQNAVIDAADSVINIIESTAHSLHGQEDFYEHPTFWVGVSFVLVILVLGRPIGKILKKLLEKRIEGIATRISDAANLKDDAQKLLVEYERKAINAEFEAADILKKSRKEIELLKKESLEKLKNEMSIKEKEAENRLLAAKTKALDEVSGLTTTLTIKAVRNAIEENLTAQNQDSLIDESIAKIASLK